MKRWIFRNMRRKSMLKVLLILFALCAAAGIALVGAVCVRANAVWTPGRADCAVVLGAHVWPDGSMSRTLTRRCEAALGAWEEGLAPTLILCGGQGKNEPRAEAEVMAEWLSARGVPREALQLDTDSHNTRTNLENARAIMAERGMGTALLCTSDYHMQRALWLARDLGLGVAGAVPAPSPQEPVSRIKSRIREACSWVLYWARKI